MGSGQRLEEVSVSQSPGLPAAPKGTQGAWEDSLRASLGVSPADTLTSDPSPADTQPPGREKYLLCKPRSPWELTRDSVAWTTPFGAPR